MTTTDGFDAGLHLRRARRIARLSQRELAERSGVPVATLARIESGATHNPTTGVVAALLAGAGCRLAVLTLDGIEIAAHPWEQERDFGGRHYPAHLDLYPVNKPYHGPGDWHGWYRDWAWRPGALIPTWTFDRLRTRSPPPDPATGETLARDEPPW